MNKTAMVIALVLLIVGSGSEGNRTAAGAAQALQDKMKDARIFQAEGWAYFRVIEPLIAEVNPRAAAVVTSIFNLTSQPARGSGDKVARALVETYDALRIRRSEVGLYRPSPIH